jgi:hypothetical protein
MLVRYGLDEVELDTEGAVEAKGVRRKLRSFMGIPRNAIAIVDGVEALPAEMVQPDSTVEFVVKEGHKGIGRVFTQKEYCDLFGLTEADFGKQIEQGLRVMQTANGAVVTETAVDSFIAGLTGGGDGAFLAVIANSLKRIADHVDPPPPDLIGTDYISGKLGVTKVWVAKMAAEGMIPKNCIVPGTGIGKPWKFYRSKIDPWILMR